MRQTPELLRVVTALNVSAVSVSPPEPVNTYGTAVEKCVKFAADHDS